MINKILFTISIVLFLLTPAYANSPLDAYMKDLKSAGSDYASGKISSIDLVCKAIVTQPLMQSDKSVTEFISSNDISEIKETYKVAVNESDRAYTNVLAEPEKKDYPKRDVMLYVLDYEKIPTAMVIYYNIQEQNAVGIFLKVQEEGERKYFAVEIIPPLHERLVYERYDGSWMTLKIECIEKSKKPQALDAIKNAEQIIISARMNGIDTSGAEEHLETSKNLFESGNYLVSEEYARLSIKVIDSLKQLIEYRSLSDEEKIKLIQDKFSDFSKEKMNRSEVVSEGTIKNRADIGSNLQFNLFVGSESNSIHSFTEVTDIDNKTITTYQNQLVGEYDLYVGVDALLLHELTLMDEANSSPFSFGKRIGIALVKGEIKIKPFWKFYKILSVLKTMGGAEAEFTKGVSSEII